MPDDKRTAAPAGPFPDPDQVRTEFVNELITSGFLNGVVNLTFATARFTPLTDGSDVVPDMIVAARLRMDLHCAAILHDAIGRILRAQTKTPTTEQMQ